MEKLAVVFFVLFVVGMLSMNNKRYHTVKFDYYICEDIKTKAKTNPITKRDLLTLNKSSVGDSYSCSKHSMTRHEVYVVTKMKAGKVK